ncbi:MAG TPA: efflux RND transporter permease subunit, partial [Bacteroidota bacterium]|nr:efflux RND transporter permease subunit [Bacteroidota bacterium]
MKISEYAVKNPQFTLIIILMVAVLGITTIMTMPRAEDPDMTTPQFTVVVIYPGTSPKDMEELVVNPLEKKLTTFDRIKNVSATITDGLAIISVDYKHGSNVDEKYQEVVREVNALRPTLPSDIYRIDVLKWHPSDVNVIQAAIVSDNASTDALKVQAEALKKDLEKIPELKNVEIHGLPEKKVRIEVHLDKLRQMNVPLEAVVGAVQSEAVNIPGGSVIAGTKSYNVQTSGPYTSTDEVRNTIITSINGRNIYVKDIADVMFQYEQETHITRLNRHRALFVVAALKPGENISSVQNKYVSVLDNFKAGLPKNIACIAHFDQADNVNKRLTGLGVDFILAIALVGITLLPLGGRASSIVMISIPLSLSIGIILLSAFGYTLNQLSIVGLVVALGLLVDDSIVVVENIERWMREGHSRLEATIKGTRQISLAVLGCTAMLVIAFLPLLFLPAASGEFIRSLPMSVVLTVLASMAVSLTVIPLLSSRILKNHTAGSEGNAFMRNFKAFIDTVYVRSLDKGLKYPIGVLIVTLCLFIGSLCLVPAIGFSLFPSSEKPQFLVEINAAAQSNLYYTDSVSSCIEQDLLAQQDVQYVSANVGKGNPQIYYNVIQENERTDFAQLFVQLHPNISAKRKVELIEELRSKWDQYPGAVVSVKDFEQGPPVLAPVEVRLFGGNLDTLKALAALVEHLLHETEGTIYVHNPIANLKTDVNIVVNKEKAQLSGVPSIAIDKMVRFAVAGTDVGVMNDVRGKSYPIYMTTAKGLNTTLSVFNNLYIPSVTGAAMPLSQIASLETVSSPLMIQHENKVRTVSVSAFVRKGYLNDKVITAVIGHMDSLRLPSGYTYEMGGELKSREESFGGFGGIIIITIFLFIAVLILEFKTFKST